MFTCPGCNSDGIDGVKCSQCQVCYCFSCANITEKNYRKLGAHRQAALLCASCKPNQSIASPGPQPGPPPAATLDIVLKELRDGVAGINVRLEPLPALIDEVKNIKQRMLQYEGDLLQIKEDLGNNTSRTAEVETEIVKLTNELHSRDQRERLNNVEIKGVPAKRNENLFKILTNICDKIGQNITSANINFIVRARSDTGHKPIVVGLTSRLLKENFVAAAKSHKNLTADAIGFAGVTNRIFINDHLTRENKQLLTRTKKAAQEQKYQYTWVQNCKILVRKNDTSPFIHIQCDGDLNKLK